MLFTLNGLIKFYVIKYIINIGSNGTINHIDCWISIIVVKLKDPVNKIIIRIAELKISS